VTVAIGDKVMVIQEDTGGKQLAIPATVPTIGGKVAVFNTNTHPISLPLSTLVVGDKVYIIPTSSGKKVILSPLTPRWIQQTASAEWGIRRGASGVVMADGSIVLTGGLLNNSGTEYNDVWRSTNKGSSWTQMTATAEWSARFDHALVRMPDDSIVLMGGERLGAYLGDVWRSTNSGASWTQQTASAWEERWGHSAVVLSDGTIIVMGGYAHNMFGDNYKNEVWKSTNSGSNWSLVVEDAEWAGRNHHSSVLLADGSIILMGGYTSAGNQNDVWRSADNGEHWTQQTASAGWSARGYHASVVLADGSIILMGGFDGNYKNDVWQSIDSGVSWTQLTDATWSARFHHSVVLLLDDSIVLMGGSGSGGNKNDVWRYV
jgi:hypothetical protein